MACVGLPGRCGKVKSRQGWKGGAGGGATTPAVDDGEKLL